MQASIIRRNPSSRRTVHPRQQQEAATGAAGPMDFRKVDWHAVFTPQHSLLEIFLRGTIMYLVMFVLLPILVRRQVGVIGMTDILVIVLIAEVTGNGISDNFQSVVESTVLV